MVLLLLQVFEIPFNSANKWSLAVTSCPGDSRHQLVFMKGAPEIVLTKCTHHLHNKQEKEIDDVSTHCLRTMCELLCCYLAAYSAAVHYGMQCHRPARWAA